MMTFSFRPMSGSDEKSVVGMVLSLYGEDPGGKAMTGSKVRRTIDTLKKVPGKGSIVVMEVDGEVAGYAILINYWSNEYGGNVVILDELYVDPRSRGKGLGSAFLRDLINTRDRETIAIMLEVLPSNTRAIEFYRRNGFVNSRYDHMVLESG